MSLLQLLSLLIAAIRTTSAELTGPLTCDEYNANFFTGDFTHQGTGTVQRVQELIIPAVSRLRISSTKGMLFSNLCGCGSFKEPGIGTLVPLSSVNMIDFQYQTFTNSDVAPSNLSCLTGMKYMILNGNSFPTGPDIRMFATFKASLLALDLGSCGINNLETDFMSNFPNLSYMDLRANDLRTLPPGFFDPCPACGASKLKTIDVSGNFLLETLPLSIFSKVSAEIWVEDLPSLTCLPPVHGNIYHRNPGSYSLPVCTQSVDVVALKSAGKTITGCMQLSFYLSIDWGADAAANLQQFLMAIVTMTRIDSTRFINPTAYRDPSVGKTVVNLEILPHTRGSQVIVDYAPFAIMTMLVDPNSALYQEIFILTNGISSVNHGSVGRRWCPTNNTYLPETLTCISPGSLSAQILGMPTVTAVIIAAVIGLIAGVSIMAMLSPRVSHTPEITKAPVPRLPSEELIDVNLQSYAPNRCTQTIVPMSVAPTSFFFPVLQESNGFNRMASPAINISYQVDQYPDHSFSQTEDSSNSFKLSPPALGTMKGLSRNPPPLQPSTSFILTSDSDDNGALW